MKKPDKNGLFILDSIPNETLLGYFWYVENLPAGFILIDLEKQPYNVNEFYIVPCYRNKGIGQNFFYEVLKAYPGRWQVKQLIEAQKAQVFWRKVISKYTSGKFEEEIYEDSYWGKVNRQLFETK